VPRRAPRTANGPTGTGATRGPPPRGPLRGQGDSAEDDTSDDEDDSGDATSQHVPYRGTLRGGVRDVDEDDDDEDDSAPEYAEPTHPDALEPVRQRDGSIVYMDQTTKQLWLAQQRGMASSPVVFDIISSLMFPRPQQPCPKIGAWHQGHDSSRRTRDGTLQTAAPDKSTDRSHPARCYQGI
jgi:hypothetical protein